MLRVSGSLLNFYIMFIPKKTLVIVLCLIGCLSFLFSFTGSDSKDATYVTVMTTEVHGKNAGPSEIEICFGEGKVEHIDLGEYSKTNRESNLEKITITLNEMRKKGYKLVTSSVAVTNFHKTELFVFEKN